MSQQTLYRPSSPTRHRVLLTSLRFLLFLILLLPATVYAQSPELELSMRRDWGYSGFGGQIQGRFTLSVNDPGNLESVAFFIDGQPMGIVTAPPWRFQFHTDNYSLGLHELSAIGYTTDGKELISNTISREFVPANQGWQTVVMIVGPLLLIALAIPVFTYLRDRRQGKQHKGYGAWGGAVCPKCGYPFARHVWAPNLGTGKYDRCPNCGKWSMVRRASPETLVTAEEIFNQANEKDTLEKDISEEEKLRKRLEESRFEHN